MVQTVNYQGYEQFKQTTNILVDLIERQIEIVRQLKKPEQEANLNSLKDLVQSNSFKVMVLGEFKRGKSTFINALLGEEILPAYSLPCTAIINEVKWSDSKTALLHFNQSDDEQKKAPLAIPVDEIEEYVVIKDDDDKSQVINESPYEKLELFWNLKLCENGVEIIDSPGLNEHKTRQQVTEKYLVNVDAIILVLSCEQLFSQSEQDVVDNKLIPMGHKDIFFVCNYINRIRKKEIEKVKNFAFKKLVSRTSQGAKRIFFINALGGLDGKLDDDIEALEESGVTELEAELQNFLTYEKGRVKILRPAQDLKNSIREIRKIIPEQKNMLRTDITELKKRYEAAQEPLKLLEKKRNSIVKKVENYISDTQQQVSYQTKDFCRELIPKMKTLAKEYKLETNIKLLFADPRPSIEAAVKEISDYLEGQIEAEFASWQTSELEPVLAKRMEQMKDSLDAEATEFINKVDNLRLEISGLSLSNLDVSQEEVGAKKVSALERIFSAAGGFLVGGIGAAAIGATFGYQEMLKSLIPQIIIGIIGYILLGFNPVTFIPMIVAALIQAIRKQGVIGDKIKEEVGKKFAEELSDATVDIVEKVGSSIAAELNKVKNLVDKGLEAEIESVRQQLNNVLAEKEKGQEEVDQKLNQLDILDNKVNKIDQELDDVISEVAI
ncbi:MAG: dynamin family protein [Xenococcus sp. (in: cyanobacteria)]